MRKTIVNAPEVAPPLKPHCSNAAKGRPAPSWRFRGSRFPDLMIEIEAVAAIP
jgi:hypothetical protein